MRSRRSVPVIALALVGSYVLGSLTSSGVIQAAGLVGDLNGDGVVGVQDLSILLNNWGHTSIATPTPKPSTPRPGTPRPGTPTPISASTPPSSGSGGKLSWAPPQLSNPTTVTVTNSNANLKLDNSKDYILKMGKVTTNVTLNGGHNVVLIGGEIATSGSTRPLYIQEQAPGGTIHVEGVHISGPNQEGIDLSEKSGATVQMENIEVDGITGQLSGAHADIVQAWNGPSVLRIDRLDGTSNYQCMMIQPKQFGMSGPWNWDLRNMTMRGNCAFYTVASSGLSIQSSNVLIVGSSKNQIFGGKWSPDPTKVASAPSPLIGQPGTNYASPGYR